MRFYGTSGIVAAATLLMAAAVFPEHANAKEKPKCGAQDSQCIVLCNRMPPDPDTGSNGPKAQCFQKCAAEYKSCQANSGTTSSKGPTNPPGKKYGGPQQPGVGPVHIGGTIHPGTNTNPPRNSNKH